MKELQKTRPVLRIRNRGGAPKGNRNARKAGLHTGESRVRRAAVRARVNHARQAIALVFAAAEREIGAMREI